jgi:NAD(P)-dependent dehydrogenase (short-subunit alcohol dehydrogenase family)
MPRLQGKIAIITGATSGIGRRTAEIFVDEGAQVVICGRRVELGRALEEQLGRDRCAFVEADVTKESDVRRVIETAVSKWGRIDCLFNNAGGPAPVGGIETIPVEGFDGAMAVLLRSVMLGMKHVAPIMMGQKSGSIINNGSVAGLRTGLSSSVVYSAAKAAVIHLTKCVAMELGEDNIRVNSISPGGIATGIFAKALGVGGDETAEKMKAGLAKMQPIHRAGLPDDIAHGAVFLASDESSFVNGHDLVVDGGAIGGRLWGIQQQALQGVRALLTED